jgi:eukaryotic-like serine/threonine-protein kinase
LAAGAALLVRSRAVTSANALQGLVGTTIAGKYAIESIVGEGGFATVFRAQHVLWKRPVAVKVFTALGQVAGDQRQNLLEDFIQEGALLADLSERSTAIVQARDIGMLVTPQGESVPYMVLEWLDGKPLEDLLEAERAAGAPLRSLEDVVRLLDPVAEALALAHSKGIAHRDVKPANIFVLSGGDAGAGGVKLLDFGIAKVVQDAQKLGFGKTAGHITSFTPLYGAPEQFNRSYGSTGPWTDVFSLALVVAEIVAGREPMSGDSIVQLGYASADEKVRPTPRTLGVTTSDEVEAIFARAVAVKPEARFANAADFWNALRTAVLGDRLASIASTRAGTTEAASASLGVGDTALAPFAPSATADTAPRPSTGPSAGAPATAPAPLEPASSSSPAKSRAPLFAGLAVVALVLAGAGAFALRGGVGGASPPGGIASGSASSSASVVPSASAPAAGLVDAAAACGAGMAMIPGGDFFMGSDETDALDSEKPPHRVTLSPYCLDVFEETVEKYKECSDHGGCRRAGKENLWPGITAAQRKIYDPLCNISDPVGKAKHPVNCVDWDQAREACASRGARLPTEAEWEFAARGPDGRIYPWGDEPPSATLLNACGKECVAWQKKHPDPETPSLLEMYDADDGFPNTAPVGSFPNGKSRYGIHDVVGNVWEWVADFHADYDPASATSTVTDPKGPAEGTDRVIRGGAWNGAKPSWVRPSFRFHAAPTARSYGFGFRCAKSL